MWMKFLFKWRYVLIIASLMATNSFTYSVYLNTRDNLTICSEKYESRTKEVEMCNGIIEKNNKSILVWKEKSKILETKVGELTTSFSIIENKYNKEIYDIINTVVPESCEGSMSWMVDWSNKK